MTLSDAFGRKLGVESDDIGLVLLPWMYVLQNYQPGVLVYARSRWLESRSKSTVMVVSAMVLQGHRRET